MLKAGVFEPSDSPWAAPTVQVREEAEGSSPGPEEGRFRMDYRLLNAVTRKDLYPLPCINDALDYISGSPLFSSLDFRSEY